MRAPRINDRPAASIAFLFYSDTIPASATTVTSGRSWAAMNDSMTGLLEQHRHRHRRWRLRLADRQAGYTSVTAGQGSQPFPTLSDWNSAIWESQFEEGFFATCQISDEGATFPYQWNGGTVKDPNSAPAATHCVPELATASPTLDNQGAMTWTDGIDLVGTLASAFRP